MQYRILLYLLTLCLHGMSQNGHIRPKISNIRDIPHESFSEKLMWPHRSFAFVITKERKVNYDTAYIKSNYKKLVITIPLSTRFLKFSLHDQETGNSLNFSPNLQYDLGLSISSRWASFIMNSGIKVFSSDNEIRGKTKQNDYQLNLYGRKVTTDMSVQYYQGFYIKNSGDYPDYAADAPYEVRPDIYALHISVGTYYIVNHRRFSYSNSFAFSEQQKKSAGSMLIGSYYSYFHASGSPSLLSESFYPSFSGDSRIRHGQDHDFGLNLGYIYTLIFLKKYYATASLVQGIGGRQQIYLREDDTRSRRLSGGAGKLHARFALEYDQGRYFFGGMVLYDHYLIRGQSGPGFDYSSGKIMLFTGYRLSVLKAERKLLRSLKLVDY